jgi:acetyl-CoA synthetase
MVRRTGDQVSWYDHRDVDLLAEMADRQPYCLYAEMGARIRSSSFTPRGSTGKPKGVVHTTAGYLVYASYTHEVCFNCQPGDVWWCTADVGWVTGHSYIVYGPLANGAPF